MNQFYQQVPMGFVPHVSGSEFVATKSFLQEVEMVINRWRTNFVFPTDKRLQNSMREVHDQINHLKHTIAQEQNTVSSHTNPPDEILISWMHMLSVENLSGLHRRVAGKLGITLNGTETIRLDLNMWLFTTPESRNVVLAELREGYTKMIDLQQRQQQMYMVPQPYGFTMPTEYPDHQPRQYNPDYLNHPVKWSDDEEMTEQEEPKSITRDTSTARLGLIEEWPDTLQRIRHWVKSEEYIDPLVKQWLDQASTNKLAYRNVCYDHMTRVIREVLPMNKIPSKTKNFGDMDIIIHGLRKIPDLRNDLVSVIYLSDCEIDALTTDALFRKLMEHATSNQHYHYLLRMRFHLLDHQKNKSSTTTTQVTRPSMAKEQTPSAPHGTVRTTIQSLLQQHRELAVKEICKLANMPLSSVQHALTAMLKKGQAERVHVGNAYYYSLIRNK